MSEITKLYENAGLFYCNKCRHDSELDCIYMCESKYPSFTAEKQIAILCWLVNLKGNVEFNNKPKDITPERVQEALAYVINECWSKLTPEQQQQIKEILK